MLKTRLRFFQRLLHYMKSVETIVFFNVRSRFFFYVDGNMKLVNKEIEF